MTATSVSRLRLAEPEEAAGLAAFLGRLLRWEKSAAVRVRAAGGVVGVFAKPARFEVLALRTARLREPVETDVTVSAGELLERIDEERGGVSLPDEVTGPSWAGVLPPDSGWTKFAEAPSDAVRSVAVAAVGEFKERAEKLSEKERTRQVLDALAEEIWSRPLGRTGFPLRAVHAGHALGLLQGGESVSLLRARGWLRLSSAHGSVVLRDAAEAGTGLGLSVTPV
ncbi:hypothetical protein [Streptomyces xiaopingdaonensis]|uniref:hypothetical protein n=1 Tax=Streptomyces xiaopingdaonensis TaxID=1565415 RepID=UPI0004944A05|nr:hypothetical protein [Streptomyces xiaopingdaonensis]